MMTSPARALPDFLILGTKRGGTTSMWNHLLDHPLVMPMFPAAQKLKSPHYFYWHFDRGPRWYRSHFATTRQRNRLARELDGQPLAGEASPYYLYHPYTPDRVRSLIPSAKLIVMLRDPVERAYSHYKERLRAGVESLAFEAALEAEDSRLHGEIAKMEADPLYYSRPHDYFTYRDRGVYLPQLKRWFACYPREQICIVRSEDFYTDRQATFSTVCDFLGLPHHELQNAKRYNYKPADPMPAAARQHLTEFFEPHNQALYEYLDRNFDWASPR
jgi:hypothetical protein